jgi:hypothetical protein
MPQWCNTPRATCAAHGVRDRRVLLPSGVILSDAMRGRVLRDIRGRGGVLLSLVRRRVHLHERQLLPCWIDKQHWDRVPDRVLVRYNGGPRVVHHGRLLVSARQHRELERDVRRRVLWRVHLLHNPSLRRSVHEPDRVLLPSRFHERCRCSLSERVVLHVHVCTRAAVPIGHVRPGSGPVRGGLLRHRRARVLLPRGLDEQLVDAMPARHLCSCTR